MSLKPVISLRKNESWYACLRKPKRFTWIIFFAWFFVLTLPSHGEEITYEVKFKGVENDEVQKALEATSNLVQLKEKSLASVSSLILRARDDEKRLPQVLRSFGYFNGKAQIDIDKQSSKSILPSVLRDKKSLEVVINIETGPVYKIGTVQVVGIDQLNLGDYQIGLKSGEPALGQSVLNAGSEMTSRIKLAGYPFVRMAKRKLRVNHLKQTMNVFFEIDPGPLASLGEVSVTGLDMVKEEFILKRVPWLTGDDYDPRILEKYRSDLSNLGVFSSIKLRIPDEENLKEDDFFKPLPVQLDVQEKEPRFFGVGGDFSTNQGIGLNAYWGHRNFFGEAEKLKIKGRLARIGENEFSRIDQILALEFQKPDFLSRRQDLLFDAQIANEHLNAFDRQNISSSLGLNRQLSNQLSISGGVKWEFSSIEDANGKDEFALFSYPMSIKHDTTNDLLDPKSGFRNEFNITPYTVALGSGGAFTKFKGGSRAYYKVTKDDTLVLAGRVLLGSIVGPATDQIPADKRFFSGGGGSIRGYEFQNVGPLDSENDPVGGRSLIEVGVEARIRYKNYGIVPFIDGGNVYDTQVPEFDQELRWAVGLGVRYYTKIGPLRVDLAAPLNRRVNDDPVAFYISIGQSF